MKKIISLLFCTAFLLALPAHAEERRSAQVSILEGSATLASSAGGSPTELKKEALVYENDTIETGASSRLEIKLKDGSVIRIGPSSKLQLKSAYLGEKGEKKVTAKLFFGRVWSKVAGLMGGDSKFEVETENAVAGVRGTTFRLDAKADKSVMVRVYAGAVAMAAGVSGVAHKEVATAVPLGKKNRVRVAGPTKISKEEWEKLVGKMMQLSINADGSPGTVTAFTEKQDEGDEWAAWNLLLDVHN